MAISRNRIEKLLRWIVLTRDRELDCDGCLAHLAEFAERELEGRSIPEGLQAVDHHLTVCAECREDYEALQRALDAL